MSRDAEGNRPELAAWPCELARSDLVVSITHGGQPLPKQRPRFVSKGWAYTAQRTRYYEKNLQAAFAEAVGLFRSDGKSAFGLRCRFYRSDLVRCDVDNLVKSIKDAATGVVWADDSQVVEVHARLYRKQEEPRVEVLIYRVRDE